mmetsp:Transcript_2661/g.4338  ORF Transcript_2661/g.4338 Transcript_2661/m.4338 type:complete len:125 (-) Transcript_2661:269-643(-)
MMLLMFESGILDLCRKERRSSTNPSVCRNAFDNPTETSSFPRNANEAAAVIPTNEVRYNKIGTILSANILYRFFGIGEQRKHNVPHDPHRQQHMYLITKKMNQQIKSTTETIIPIAPGPKMLPA